MLLRDKLKSVDSNWCIRYCLCADLCAVWTKPTSFYVARWI